MSPASVINESAQSSQRPRRFVFIPHSSDSSLILFSVFSHLSICSSSQILNKLYFAAIKFVILFLKQRKVCFVLFTFSFFVPKTSQSFSKKIFRSNCESAKLFQKATEPRLGGQGKSGWCFTARAHCGPQ